MQVNLSITISLIALLVSLVTLYFQWFRVRGAIISLLNTEEQEQRTVLLPSYSRLPEVIRQQFSEYAEKHSGYAEVVINFANAGDRAGITEILKVEVGNPSSWSEVDRIRASYTSYCLVPAYEMKDHTIVLRNIPPVDSETTIALKIKFAWGGAKPRTGKYIRKDVVEQNLKILLVPSELKPSTSKRKKTG